MQKILAEKVTLPGDVMQCELFLDKLSKDE